MIFKREPEDGEKVQIKQIETGKSKSKKQVKKANKLRTTSPKYILGEVADDFVQKNGDFE